MARLVRVVGWPGLTVYGWLAGVWVGGRSAQCVAYVHTHMHNNNNNQARFGGEAEAGAEAGAAIPKPPHWGGFRLVPDRVEFWKGRQSRLHDRLRYTRAPGDDAGGWRVERLAP